MDLEKLRLGISVPLCYKELWEKLLLVGEENLVETGVELIRKIKLLRGCGDGEISKICGIRQGDLEKILDGTWKISVGMATKLSHLGYTCEAFLKSDKQ